MKSFALFMKEHQQLLIFAGIVAVMIALTSNTVNTTLVRVDLNTVSETQDPYAGQIYDIPE